MKNKEYFWTMKNGEKINVDDMTESHLKNVLKLIIRRAKEEPKDCEHHVDDAMDLASYDDTPFCDDWMWKQFYFITYTRFVYGKVLSQIQYKYATKFNNKTLLYTLLCVV